MINIMEYIIEEYLNKYFKFDKFIIHHKNDEYYVDIIGDLIVKNNFEELPENFFKFNSINGSLYIVDTKIKNLFGFPICVYNNLIISNNDNLTFINNIPNRVFGRVTIKNNKLLENICIIPNFISKTLNISNNQNLKYCFISNNYIGENLIIKNNPNIILNGYSKNIRGKLYTSFKNKLKIFFSRIFNK